MRRTLPLTAARFGLALVMLPLVAVALAAQPTTVPAALAARLDSALDALRRTYGVTGVGAAIVSPRHGTWVGAAGVADIETGEAARGEMLFGIGSITKTHTSALILKLVEEGRLALDDTIGTWIRDVRNVDGRVTVRQLLAHTSGLYNYTDSPQFWASINEDLDHSMTPEEILTFVGPAGFSPGFGWAYSNTNYVLLGMIAAAVTGDTYETALEERILRPHDLTMTAWGTLDTLPGPHSGNHVDIDGDGDLDNLGALPRRAIYSGAWAAGGLYATAADVARWGNLLYTGRVLSPASMTAMTTFRNVAELGPGGGYGLGAIRARALGRTVWGHTGGIPGFSAALWHFVADSVTVAVLVNDDAETTSELAILLAQELFRSPVSSVAGDAVSGRGGAHPNPFTMSTTLTLDAARPGPATARVYTTGGELVRTLHDGDVAAGRSAITWDGTDASGSPVPAGVYVVRMQVGEMVESRMVVRR